jgi:hypothetical protein
MSLISTGVAEYGNVLDLVDSLLAGTICAKEFCAVRLRVLFRGTEGTLHSLSGSQCQLLSATVLDVTELLTLGAALSRRAARSHMLRISAESAVGFRARPAAMAKTGTGGAEHLIVRDAGIVPLAVGLLVRIIHLHIPLEIISML